MAPFANFSAEWAAHQFGLGLACRRALNARYRYEITVLIGPWFLTLQVCRGEWIPPRDRHIRHSTR